MTEDALQQLHLNESSANNIYSSYSIYSEIIPSIQQVYVEVGKQDQ